MFKQIILYLFYLILTLHCVRVGKVEAVKDGDSEQPFTIYIDAGNEIGNVANNIATYGSKQDSMEQTLKSVQNVMGKIEQRLVEIEKTFKTAANIQEIVAPFVKTLENRLSDIENKLSSTENKQQNNYDLIEQRLNELGLNLTMTLSTHAADQNVYSLVYERLDQLENVINMRANKANLKLEVTSNKTYWPQSRVFGDCADAKRQLGSLFINGIYNISVPNFEPFNVYCLKECASCCPWTIVMMGSERSEGSFYQRSWFDYKYGFGSANKDFFIGLNRLHVLTKLAPQALLIRDYNKNSQVMFKEFSIKDEQYNYVVDNLVSFNEESLMPGEGVGDPFSSDSVCAKMRGRSWWYNQVCVASLGKEALSDNIFMAIQPKECQLQLQ